MTETLDSEFGTIAVYRRRGATRISFRMGTNGQPKITAPFGVPKLALKIFLRTSHAQIAKIINDHRAKNHYLPGMVIGKTHLLKLEYDAGLAQCQIKVRPNFLVVRLPMDRQIEDESVQVQIRPYVKKLLKKQAKEILLPRLAFLAREHGFKYQHAKLSHASTRWGSCSSKGVITLNISLVSLSNELIDYVLIHELCHLRQMNHSRAFWAEVGRIIPNYRQCESHLKQFMPHV